MSDWIRPAGCEGGACVEYRTIGGKVFLRNPAKPDVLVEFTAAEWDTFVAGLTAQVTAERDAVTADHRSTFTSARSVVDALTAERDKLGQDYVRVMTERDNLAAENARLRQQAGRYEAAATETFRQLNEAIAEAAVLRHRDRRTRAVVEAAVELITWWRKMGPDDPDLHPLTPLARAVDAYATTQRSGLVDGPAAELRDAKIHIPDNLPIVDIDGNTVGVYRKPTEEAPAKDQDRTEVGLDAAIEAAWQAYRDAHGPAGHFQAIEAAVRAASPLIERAALNAAAEAWWQGDGYAFAADDSTVPDVHRWLRDRATRTETP